MSDYQMGAVESKFADIIWENEPISSTELSKRSEEILLLKVHSALFRVKKRYQPNSFNIRKQDTTIIIFILFLIRFTPKK